MREYKPGAFGIILVHPYLTSQILDYQPADGQSQPRTLGIFIQFLETFKNPVALIGRNTATGIRHRQFQLLMLFVYGNRQFNRTGRGKFSGIGQQINQYLLQALGIRLDNQRSYRSFEQKQSAGLASDTTLLHHIPPIRILFFRIPCARCPEYHL